MERYNHTLASLFDQLGLDNTDHAIETFIKKSITRYCRVAPGRFLEFLTSIFFKTGKRR